MTIWIDAQLSPHLAPWLTEHCGVEAYSVRYLPTALSLLERGESLVELSEKGNES
jgi:hypothetical protein